MESLLRIRLDEHRTMAPIPRSADIAPCSFTFVVSKLGDWHSDRLSQANLLALVSVLLCHVVW